MVEPSSLTALRHGSWLAGSFVTGVLMTPLIYSNRVVSREVPRKGSVPGGKQT